MTRQPKDLAKPNEPLGRVVLVPLDGITVIHGELVMKVVIAFPNGDKRGEDVVAWSVFVIEGSLAQPMRERVDAKGRLAPKVSAYTDQNSQVRT